MPEEVKREVDPLQARIGPVSLSALSGADPMARGLHGLGLAMSRLSRKVKASDDKEDALRKRERLAHLKVETDFQREHEEAWGESKPDGSDFYEKAQSRFKDYAHRKASEVEDREVRVEYEEYLASQAINELKRVYRQSRDMRADAAGRELDRDLGVLMSNVSDDPSLFEGQVALGRELLSAYRGMDRGKVASKFERQMAVSAVESRISKANDPYALDMIEHDLRVGPWKERMAHNDYVDLKNSAYARRKLLRRQFTSVAKAKVAAVEKKTDHMMLVDQEEIVDVQRNVELSEDAGAEDRLARASRNQQLLRRYRYEGPDELDRLASEIKQRVNSRGGVDKQTQSAIAGAANGAGGKGVSESYLRTVAMLESGGTTDHGVKSDTSSATGIYQFIESTWISLAKNHSDELGVDPSSMTRKELLALRAEPETAARAAAVLARENKRLMERKLGRAASDPELYIGHVFGASQGAELIRATVDQDNHPAEELFPKAARANRALFYDRKGAPLAVSEVYDLIVAKYVKVQGDHDLGDALYIEKMSNDRRRKVKKNPIGFGNEMGLFAEDEGSLADGIGSGPQKEAIESRQAKVDQIALMTKMPVVDLLPLQPFEVNAYKALFAGDDIEAKGAILADFAHFDPDTRDRAFEQLDFDGMAEPHVSGLFARGKDGVALDILRGQEHLQKDKDAERVYGFTMRDVHDQFGAMVREYTKDAAPGVYTSLIHSAVALHVQRQARHGKAGLGEDDFVNALNAVLGGSDKDPVLADFNGGRMVLPPGLTEDRLEEFVESAGPDDWRSLHEDGLVPRFGRGDAVGSFEDVQFSAIGGGQYLLQLEDEYLTTGRVNERGEMELYVVTLSEDLPMPAIVERPPSMPSISPLFGGHL